MTVPRLSIIIPTLNESAGIVAHLAALQVLRPQGVELVVVDGGSADDTVRLAQPLADRVLAAPRGRGAQMNVGARAASGDVLLFLHADTRLPRDAPEQVHAALADGQHVWGRFDVAIAGSHPFLHVIAWCINQRSRWTGIATGDQAIFVRRDVFEAAGRFAEIALMEDVALAKRLRRWTRPRCLECRVTTSGRRWQARGVLRTMLLMWLLRLGYWLGCKPAFLARLYA
jgi:rSAM/selenodomain-associated transferase 2